MFRNTVSVLYAFIIALMLCSTPTFAKYIPDKINEIDTLIEEYSHNPLGWPALHYAISENQIEVALEIIRYDSNYIHLFAPFKDIHFRYHQYTSDYSFSESLGEAFNHLSVQHSYNHLRRGPSPLILAVTKGSIELASELLKRGADINAAYFDVKSFSGDKRKDMVLQIITPLSAAIEAHDIEMVTLLLEQGAPLDNITQTVAPFFQYISSPGGLRGQGPGSRISYGWSGTHERAKSALNLAGENDDLIRVLLFYQMKKSISLEEIPEELIATYKKYERNSNHYPSLYQAIISNDVRAFQLLLDYGADPLGLYGNKTGIDFALESRNPLFFELIQSYVADGDVSKRLLYAVISDHAEGVKIFLNRLDFSVLPNQEDYLKELFEAAISRKYGHLVEYFFEVGLDHTDVFKLAVDHRSVPMLSIVLQYKKPSKQEVKEAILQVLKGPNPDSDLLEILYDLKRLE